MPTNARCLRQFEWPARVVIMMAEVGTVSALLVFSMVLGLVPRLAVT